MIEEKTNFVNSKLKIKILEESGTPLIDVLQKYVSQVQRFPCEDIEHCLQCKNNDVGKCHISHITYKLECLEIGCLFF